MSLVAYFRCNKYLYGSAFPDRAREPYFAIPEIEIRSPFNRIKEKRKQMTRLCSSTPFVH